MTLSVTVCTDQAEWDRLVNDAGGHPLQLWGWGQVKGRYEWSPRRLVVQDGDRIIGSAQVLLRTLPAPFRRLAYVPRGPQAAEADRVRVLDAIVDHLRTTDKPIGLTIEPDWQEPFSPLPKGASQDDVAALITADRTPWLTDLARSGFTRSTNTGLIPRTLIVDVSGDEDAIMKGFGSSTRQNVRKSFKAEDVRFGRVETEQDLQQVLDINRATGQRAGFGVHSDDYHRAIRDELGERSQLIAAWEGQEIVAFVWLVVSGRTAFELYGGVSPRGMKLRLNYGLKFWAMKHVKEQGVERYDFNGLLNDGISDFKRQFAKHEDLLIGTWDRPLSPLFAVFSKALPVARRALKRGLPAARAAARNPRAALAQARTAVSRP